MMKGVRQTSFDTPVGLQQPQFPLKVAHVGPALPRVITLQDFFWSDVHCCSPPARFISTRQQGYVVVTTLALLIAEGAPTGMDLMVRLIVNLLTEPTG